MTRHTLAAMMRSLAIGALVVATVCAGCSSGGGKHSTTTTAERRSVPGQHPSVGVTAEQLDAHLGIGVPKGWDPVDLADARLWVPDTWTIKTNRQACRLPDRPAPVGVVGLGTADLGCPGEADVPQPSVSLLRSPVSPTGAPYEVVHGYAIYNVTSLAGRGSHVYDVPDLQVRIVLRGVVAGQILDTLAPSSQDVALAFAIQPQPHTFRRLVTDGVSLRVPSRWALVTAPAVECYWPVSPNGVPEVVRIRPHIPVGSCATYSSIPFALVPNDGILVYTAASSEAPRRGHRPIIVVRHNSTTITVYPGTSGVSLDTLNVFAHRAGSTITHVLTIGLGRDGRTAGGVVASIDAIS
jgi:hypothetical protein